MTSLAMTLVLTLSSPIEAQESESSDSGLVALVDQVKVAADRRDHDSLHELMSEDFLYSFGGSRSRDEATAWFKRRPELLNKLVEVLSGNCAITEYSTVVHHLCPAEAAEPKSAYYDYRAGFRLTNHNNWQFVWFVAGD